MTGGHWRLLEPLFSDGFHQMALDQAVFEAVEAGESPPTIRFYGFCPPCLSIGRFQSVSHVDRAACKKLGVDLVRRPTGGRALLHRDDFTYMLVLPLGGLPTSVEESYARISLGIIEALRELEIVAELVPRPRVPGQGDRSCFAVPASADLVVGGKKICGSAQTRGKRALLQHGTILRRRDTDIVFELLCYGDEPEKEARKAYEDSCIGLEDLGSAITWEELERAMVGGFSRSFHADLRCMGLASAEKERYEHILEVYSSKEWIEAVP